jgi:hypothetical protein
MPKVFFLVNNHLIIVKVKMIVKLKRRKKYRVELRNYRLVQHMKIKIKFKKFVVSIVPKLKEQ